MVSRKVVKAGTARSYSVRLTERGIRSLAEEAARAHTAPRTLAQELIEEGLRMRRFPAIVFAVRGGRRAAVFAGAPRLRVSQAIETVEQSESLKDAAEYLALHPSAVEQAADYYREYREEIDREIEEDRAYSEQAEREWRERRSTMRVGGSAEIPSR